MTDAKTASAESHMAPGPSFWQSTRRSAWITTAIWAVAALLLPLAAQQLEAMAVLGIPLGYYLGAQGALVVAAILLLLRTRRQSRIDTAHGL